MTVWAPRALAEVERQISTWPQRAAAGAGSFSVDHWVNQLQRLEQEAQRLREGGLAVRGGRRMPSLKQIAAYHDLGDRPECFRCRWPTPVETWSEASCWLERAHIIDRAVDGLDGPQNLLPLCGSCHRHQSLFDVGQEAEAMEWFNVFRLR